MQINYRDWMDITNMTHDQKLVPVEAVFMHGWGDMHDRMIDFVAETYHTSGAKYVVLNGLLEYEFGKPGIEYWRKSLVAKNIPDQSILGVLPARHTREEAICFMKFARENNIKRGIVISTPPHIVRAFLTNLSQIEEHSMNIELYPLTIKNINWEEKIDVRGILSTTPEEDTSRIGRFAGEWGRTIGYRQNYENGDKNYSIASVKKGIEYLKSLPQ